MAILGWTVLGLAVVWVLAYQRAPLLLWTAIVAAALGALTYCYAASSIAVGVLWGVFILIALALNFPPLRRPLISNRVLTLFRQLMPPMSPTEREALEAGTVWWEAELFSGHPNWRRLLRVPAPALSADEKAFLAGPVETLCQMLNDWEVTHEQGDLPPEVWAFIRKNRFFGMIIPKQYGGLEFSAQAHSAVVMKIASHSLTAGVTVMVPNSLGPAELLLHYGTEAQKNHYLPRLARGDDVPCFALTGPEAGSDASAIPDYGVVCKQEFQGKRDVLGIRITWDKRYITLGPVATVLGLAFKLFDPERLLGPEIERGITLALIPTDTPGVNIGNRHNPLNIPFQNGPNSGREVFIPMDWLIGGPQYIGQGWRMLVERLAVGRGISLPALSAGAGKLAARATGAYARVRKQFRLPIGKLEGVEEALTRIGGETYLIDAARQLTLCGLDQGEQPSVVSAIMKYQLTERMRRVINDAMDVQGGSGICLGPRNYIGRAYQGLPISITVEGANILTRSLIIYGQGAVRAHPFLRAEMQAAADGDTARARKTFDRALFGHIGSVISNMARALWFGISGSRLAGVPFVGPTRCYAQRLTRYSAAFAFVSDIALATLGGNLKRREKLSGRLADVLSLLYLGSAALKHFEDQGQQKSDEPLLAWACDDSLYRIEQALLGLLHNLPNRPLACVARVVIFPFGARARPPSDDLGRRVAAILLEPSAARERLTAGIYIPSDPASAVGRIEHALTKVIAADAVERKLQHLTDVQGVFTADAMIDAALTRGLISVAEAELARSARAARLAAIAVDDFAPAHF
jgi:acyl-CoA dehydrogenase